MSGKGLCGSGEAGLVFSAGVQFPDEWGDDGFREEMLQAFMNVLVSHFGDLLDERAGDVSKTVGGHEEDGFDVFIENAVSEGH